MRSCPYCGSPSTDSQACPFCGRTLGGANETVKTESYPRGSQTSEQELADQLLLGGGRVPDPDRSGANASLPLKRKLGPLSGLWLAEDGSGYNVQGSGPEYQLFELHPMAGAGAVGQGVASLEGTTVIIQSQNYVAGPWSAQYEISGDTMSGTLFGIPVRFTRRSR